jgi:hypothetical protein
MAGKPAADPMHASQFGVLHLSRTAFAAQLANSLYDEEDTQRAGMSVR